MLHRLLSAVALTVCTALTLVAQDPFVVIQDDDGLGVFRGERLVTRYLERSGAKPIFWPLIGPYGVEMTRGYPMREASADEAADHPHHRSLWFTHGDVNGISFWHENDSHGTIVHREYLQAEGGAHASIQTVNDWIGPDGRKHCEDHRTFAIGGEGAFTWIDATIVVTAGEGGAVFGDTKEGSFGVRVAGTMKEDSDPGGRVFTSEGFSGAEAWGRPARWVDYSGPVDGHHVGIAIMNHPSSYGFPSHWHVRTYGLFAANPFGLSDFPGEDEDRNGSLTLEAGQSFTLRYRVLLHPGDHEEGRVEAFYEAFADNP